MLKTSLFFVVLKSPRPVPTKFHCCQPPNGRVNLGAFCPPPPPSNIGSPDPIENRVNGEIFMLKHLSTNRYCQHVRYFRLMHDVNITLL